MTKFVPGGPPRYRHQKQALRKTIEQRGTSALLMEPGLGKTATALDYASLLALKASSGEARILVVGPLAAVDTWVSQAETYVSPQVTFWAEALGGSIRQKAEALAARGGRPLGKRLGSHAPRLAGSLRAEGARRALALSFRAAESRTRPLRRVEGPDGLNPRPGDPPRLVIIAVNLDAFGSRRSISSSRTVADLMLSAVQRYGPDLVIVDESHKIKGDTANASRLLGRIGPTVPRRMILTGTVMPHSPLDVWAQWRFLDPEAFTSGLPGRERPMSFGDFKARFAVMGGYMGKEVKGYRDLDVMQDVMAERAFVATKDEALDLPPMTSAVVPVHLDDDEHKAYDQMKNDLALSLDDGTLATVGNRLTQMMRLRQITAGHLPADDGTLRSIGQSKVNTIRSLVHDTLVGEDRIVVFAVFRAEIDDLARALAQRGTTVEVVTGDTHPAERTRIRQRFGDTTAHPERVVLIAQIKTMSLAVNELVTASHVVFATLSQQRDDLIQARDRLNRIGQQRPMTAWYCLAPKTIDEVVYRSHLDRSNLEQAVIEHIRSTHEEER